MELDFTQTPNGNFHALGNCLIGLFTGQAVNGGFAGGNILGCQTSADPESGGDHAVQTKGSHGILDFLHFRLRNFGFRQGNLGQMNFGPSGRGEVLQNIGGNFLGHKEVIVFFTHTDIADSFPSDTGTHQRAEKVPVGKGITFIEGCTQAANYFRSNDAFYTNPQDFERGDQIFFKRSDGAIYHTGIITGWDENGLEVVAGNTNGSMVAIK